MITRRICDHNWLVTNTSNVVKLDPSGAPAMLCKCICTRCWQDGEQWIEAPLTTIYNKEVAVLKWSDGNINDMKDEVGKEAVFDKDNTAAYNDEVI